MNSSGMEIEPPSTPTANGKRASDSSSPFLVPSTPMMSRIACGTGISVYHLHRSPRSGQERSPWAVKRVQPRQKRKDTTITERLLKEAEILRALDHPNIVGFRGFTKTANGNQALLLEECSGSLGDLIEELGPSHGPFPVRTIFWVVSSSAAALDYLHTVQRLIHGDIKSFNILIKGNFESIKLCDFGVSLKLSEDGTSSDDYIGTLPWSGPEALTYPPGPLTPALDIFALGLTVWEMLALRPPHTPPLEESTSSKETSFTEDLDITEEEPPYGSRPELPELTAEYTDVISVFNWTTEEDFRLRPTAKALLDRATSLL